MLDASTGNRFMIWPHGFTETLGGAFRGWIVMDAAGAEIATFPFALEGMQGMARLYAYRLCDALGT